MVSARETVSKIQRVRESLRVTSRAEALETYEVLAHEAEEDAIVQTELGYLCLDLELYDQAVKHYRKAVEQAPGSPIHLANLGIGLQRFGEPSEALEMLHQALDLDEQMPIAQCVLGELYARRNQHDKARVHLEKAHEMNPGNPLIQANLASALSELGEYEEALVHAKKAARSPKAGEHSYHVLARIFSELGKKHEAVQYFEQAIKQYRTFGVAYSGLASLKKFSTADKPFIKKTEKVLERSMPAHDRKAIHFALGKMYDDCKEYDKAFSHYRKGNTLDRTVLSSLKRDQWKTRVLRKTFTKPVIDKFRKEGDPTEQPVFVVGMPRSGTTLIEQMIASHRQGGGAGELPEIPRIADELFRDKRGWFLTRELKKELTRQFRQSHAAGYLEILQQGRQGAERIVDKMPANFMFLGLIDSLFPNATIIHAIRHPLDICVSCYVQPFKFLEWSNQFSTIADMYELYRAMMDHWRKVLPEGRIVDVHYEKLIDSPEEEGRRLLNACGLDWDANVLRFYEQKSAVKTASLSQVRQPIYKSSRMRWMRYAPYIGELATRLAPYLPEGQEELKERGVPVAGRSRIGRWIGGAGGG